MNNLVFESKKAVLEFLASIESLCESEKDLYTFRGIYHLFHREYAPPEYTPRRYKDGWSIHVTYYYLPGTLHFPKNGRVDPETFFNKFSYISKSVELK